MTPRFFWRAIAWPKFLRPIVRDRWLALHDHDLQTIALELNILRGDQPVSAHDVATVWARHIQTPVIAWLESL